MQLLTENVLALSLQSRSGVHLSEPLKRVQVFLAVVGGSLWAWGLESAPCRQASPSRSAPSSLYPALLSLSPKSQGKRRVTHCKGRRHCGNLIALWAKLRPRLQKRSSYRPPATLLVWKCFVMQTTWVYWTFKAVLSICLGGSYWGAENWTFGEDWLTTRTLFKICMNVKRAIGRTPDALFSGTCTAAGRSLWHLWGWGLCAVILTCLKKRTSEQTLLSLAAFFVFFF